ncbi:MAG: histidine phosphatase family protein [Bacteroidota bacterium]|nr:histidine phosphatase family protein [Bacteroidota bacterium]
MKIYLIRHAEAIDYETNTVKDDEYRFITPNGRLITRKIGKVLMEELKDLDKIFTSPLIRAVQTAEIIATRLKFKNDVELANELKNESTTSSLQQLINNNSNFSSIALVGHEPKISTLVKIFSDKKDLSEFRKSSVCLIDFDIAEQAGKFIWYFDSKQMEFMK